MQATVIEAHEGMIWVRVGRNTAEEQLDYRQYDLNVGDIIEVKRVVNNPFLTRVKSTD